MVLTGSRFDFARADFVPVNSQGVAIDGGKTELSYLRPDGRHELLKCPRQTLPVKIAGACLTP